MGVYKIYQMPEGGSMNQKPLDTIKRVMIEREAMNLCRYLSEKIHTVHTSHSIYWCSHSVVKDLEDLPGAIFPCTVEDWATCPLNKEAK